jgi:enoyl-CoA hydratase/carnithine racemase
MSGKVLLYEVKDNIAFVTMNRPDKLNALNKELVDALEKAWIDIENDSEVWVAILSGAGRAFCAGMDVSPGALDPDVPHYAHRAYQDNSGRVFKPIIAAVQGYCLGSGFALGVKYADLTIATDSAQFGFPEVKIGSAVPPMDYLPIMPYKLSLQFYLSGENMSAQRAYQIGLVNEVVTDKELIPASIRWAELIKKAAPLTLRSIKYGHWKSIQNPSRLQEREFDWFVLPQKQSEDSKEGLKAFQEKRSPRFKGK